MEDFLKELLFEYKNYAYGILFVWCLLEGEIALILGGILGDVKKIGRKGGIIIFNIIATVSTVLGIFKKILFEFTSPISFGSTSTFISLVMDYVVELYPTKIRDNSSGILFSS